MYVFFWWPGYTAHPKNYLLQNGSKITFFCVIIVTCLLLSLLWESLTPSGLPHCCAMHKLCTINRKEIFVGRSHDSALFSTRPKSFQHKIIKSICTLLTVAHASTTTSFHLWPQNIIHYQYLMYWTHQKTLCLINNYSVHPWQTRVAISLLHILGMSFRISWPDGTPFSNSY